MNKCHIFVLLTSWMDRKLEALVFSTSPHASKGNRKPWRRPFLIVPDILRSFILKKWNKPFSLPAFIDSHTSGALTVDSGRGSGSILWPSTPRTKSYRVFGPLPSCEMNPIGFLNNSMASASGLTSCYSSRVTCLLHWSKITLTTVCLGIKLLVCVPASATWQEGTDHASLNPIPQSTWHRPWLSVDAQ